MTAVTVRPATQDDRDAVVGLILALNLFEDAISHDRTTDRASAIRHYNEHLETMRTDTTAALLVAEREARVAGYLFFLVETRPVFVREAMRRVGYISELCVAEGARGQGVGRALLAAAADLARRHGVAHLGLTVLAGNERAHAVYRESGFRDYAIELLKPVGGADRS